MGLPNEVNSALIGAAAAGGYQIENSLRFRGGQSLSRASVSTLTQGGISFWIKFNRNFDDIFAAVTDQMIQITSGFGFARNPSAKWYYRPNSSGGGDEQWDGRTNNDTSAWYHVLLKFNSSSSTSFYLNGVLVGTHSFSISSITNTLYIGRDANGTYYAQFYLAEFHWVGGGSVDVTDFGEFNDDGVWVPKAVTGLTYGTQGFYLDFSDPSNIGTDRSGNGNNLTPSGFTTSGTGTDVLSDTPTTNYATFNPLAPSRPALSDGNLSLSFTNSGSELMSVPVTIGATSGKFYVEFKYTASGSGGSCGVGVVDLDTAPQLEGYLDGWTRIIYDQRGVVRKDNSNVATSLATTRTAGDVVGIDVDCDNGQVRFYVNGTLQHTQTGLSYGRYGFHFEPNIGGSNNTCTVVFNGGQRAFEQTVPSGYKALNTASLPAPDIADGSEYFQTVLWTGDGATSRNITTNFSPDFAIIKQRNDIYGFGTYDNVRGGGKFLRTDGADTETTNPADGYVSAFNSTSVTLAKGSYGWNVNGSGYTYVGWFWDGGGTGSSNTSGSITSTVSANPTAGFSIVSYTGTGSGATVGHGLGVTLDLIITKNRDASVGWGVYHKDLGGNTKYLNLNDSAGVNTNANIWNSTSPTSTVFSVGTDGTSNGTGEDMIAYCFAEVEGFSRFGIYTGNGSDDGPFVYTGMRPRFLLYKRTDSSQPWYIIDSARDPFNVSYKLLTPNNATAEDTGSSPVLDLLSNGFKPRNSYATLNASGGTYVFIAFAENPFGGEGVSPATAR